METCIAQTVRTVSETVTGGIHGIHILYFPLAGYGINRAGLTREH